MAVQTTREWIDADRKRKTHCGRCGAQHGPASKRKVRPAKPVPCTSPGVCVVALVWGHDR